MAQQMVGQHIVDHLLVDGRSVGVGVDVARQADQRFPQRPASSHFRSMASGQNGAGMTDIGPLIDAGLALC